MTTAANLASVASIIQAPTGTAPAYQCRAWVNFNGTGTVAIRASGNVSSITDNGTGDYTVNFTTAMPDANYSVTSITSATGSGGPVIVIKSGTSYSTSSFSVTMGDVLGLRDVVYNNLAIFR